jgi:hypothetical protein
MNPEIKAQWLGALRSGEYKQSKGYLRKVNDTFCCIGVLTDLAVKAGVIEEGKLVSYSESCYEYAGNTGDTPAPVCEWSGLDQHTNRDVNVYLMEMNDTHDKNFNEIADWIEENL